MKLFTLMKGFFGKTAPAPEPEADPSADSTPDQSALEYNGYATAEGAPVDAFVSAPVEAAVAEPVQIPMVDANSSEIILPLSSIVSSLPVELQQRVRTDVVGQTLCAFPLDKVLPQLSQGLVRVTFGEIRQSAPQAFTGGADRDFAAINLPLNELISRIAPTLFGRAARRQVEVPEEITSPFGPRGQGLTFGKRISDTSMTSRPRGAQSQAPVPPAMDVRARGNVTSVPRPSAPGGTTVFGKKPATTPPPPSATPASIPPPVAMSLEHPFHKPPIIPIVRTPNGGNGGNGSSHVPVVPPSAPARAEAPKAEPATISVSLAALGDALPEALRLEVAHLNLGDASIALPVDEVEPGMRNGRLVFAWKQLRAWLKPAAPASVSAHDNLSVSLPLPVVAPLFLGRLKLASDGQKRVVVDDKIPNLFFGFPQPEAAPAPAPSAKPAIPVLPAPKPSETNYFVWDDEKEEAHVETTPPPARTASVPAPARPLPGTTFASRKATPNEVVTKASLLEGVYGALVALPDGLLVAAKLDPAANGDTIAALIPQMYSKLSGCTKELRMGELNNLNFTVGNVPWKIFRVNGLFFAAFGCAGEPLPTAHLAELAAALDYKKAQ